MNVLSLFDGLSAAQIALCRAGIVYKNYYASEIDKYAIAVTRYNYPNTIQLGDVNNVNFAEFGKIDLLIGGSPCQGFSIAGKHLNFNDNRSKLFFKFVEALETTKPRYFLLENVSMKKEWRDIITSYLGVEPVKINSAIFSAQNRIRLYWTNIPLREIPEDKGIKLQDILESGYTDREKSYCITAIYCNTGNLKDYFERGKRQLIYQIPRGNNKGGIKAVNGKTPSLTTSSWQYNNFLISKYGMRKLTLIECERLQTIPDNYTKYGIFNGQVKQISNTQRYKMIGNSFTVDVVAYILKGMNCATRNYY